jgi:hypothetical protein
MFVELYSDINSLKYGLLHLTSQPNFPKGRSVKVRFGVISETKFLGTILVGQLHLPYASQPSQTDRQIDR